MFEYFYLFFCFFKATKHDLSEALWKFIFSEGTPVLYFRLMMEAGQAALAVFEKVRCPQVSYDCLAFHYLKYRKKNIWGAKYDLDNMI